MESSEIQSQWEHENSRLQNFRSVFITINVLLISLINFKSADSAELISKLSFYSIITTSVLANLFWSYFQRKMYKSIQLWGDFYFEKLSEEGKMAFENMKVMGIRIFYTIMPFAFILWSLTVLAITISD